MNRVDSSEGSAVSIAGEIRGLRSLGVVMAYRDGHLRVTDLLVTVL